MVTLALIDRQFIASLCSYIQRTGEEDAHTTKGSPNNVSTIEQVVKNIIILKAGSLKLYEHYEDNNLLTDFACQQVSPEPEI